MHHTNTQAENLQYVRLLRLAAFTVSLVTLVFLLCAGKFLVAAAVVLGNVLMGFAELRVAERPATWANLKRVFLVDHVLNPLSNFAALSLPPKLADRITGLDRVGKGKRWFRRTCGSTLKHKCGVCNSPLYDQGDTGSFQDYACPEGHYEFHFDCGTFNVRVGTKTFQFHDDDQVHNNLTLVGKACDEYQTLT